MIKRIEKFLVCPKCHSALEVSKDKTRCTNSSCDKTFGMIGTIYDFSNFGELDEDLRLSIDKWDKAYMDELKRKNLEELYKTYMNNNFSNVYRQINSAKEIDNSTVFLEIGCGPMFLGRALADKCQLVVGIDFSIEALKMAEKIFNESGIENYLLILGDIRNMPLADETVDIVYGGGVIEHFRDTIGSILEFYRVLKFGGMSFNTVPHLNIGSLTYRQVWGNIPEFPLIKQIAEGVHLKLLGAKHMRFGYELSFLGIHMKYLHKKVGFKKVLVKKFETKLLFELIPYGVLRNVFDWVANNTPLFWPMIKVIGYK